MGVAADKIIIYVWIALGLVTFAAGIIAPILLIPIIQVVALPFIPFPTIFAYATVTFVVYFLVRFLLRSFAPGRTNTVILALAIGALAAAVLGLGVPLIANWSVEKRVALIKHTEVPGKIRLRPVNAIALITFYGPTVMPPVSGCDSFCVSLLMSGYATEVLVAARQTKATAVPPNFTATRYILSADPATCVKGDSDWDKYFAGRSLDVAKVREVSRKASPGVMAAA